MRSLRALLASIVFMACFGVACLAAGTLLLGVVWEGEGPGIGALLAFTLADAVQSFLGGALCAWIARRQREVVVLAVFVVLGGGLTAAGLEWLDWQGLPHWMLWSEPFLDSFAVLLGGRLLARRSDPGRAESGGRVGVVPGPIAP